MSAYLKLLIASSLALSASTFAPLPFAGVTEAAAQSQVGSCFSHYQEDGTIHVQNDCGYSVWFVACVTPIGSSYTTATPWRGITEGSDELTPSVWPAAYTYYMLTTANIVGWDPRC